MPHDGNRISLLGKINRWVFKRSSVPGFAVPGFEGSLPAALAFLGLARERELGEGLFDFLVVAANQLQALKYLARVSPAGS